MRKTVVAFGALALVAVASTSWIYLRPNETGRGQSDPDRTPPTVISADSSIPTTTEVAPPTLVRLEEPSERTARLTAVRLLNLDEVILAGTSDDAATTQRNISAASSAEALAVEVSDGVARLKAQYPGISIRVAPIAVRTASYESDRAEIDLYYVRLWTIPGKPAVADEWRTLRMRLVWEGGEWRISSQRSTPGPWPQRVQIPEIRYLSADAFEATLRGYSDAEVTP